MLFVTIWYNRGSGGDDHGKERAISGHERGRIYCGRAGRKSNIWIGGGASVAGQLLKEGRIDTLWLSVIPTMLGKGVRLFPELEQELPLKLAGTEHYNRIVDLVYEKR